MPIHENIRNLDLKGAKLITVTKNTSPELISKAIQAGVTDLGENYVQEAIEKKRLIKDKAKWHMIGSLQSNKVKQAVSIFDVIQTIDSYKLARKIDKEAKKIEKIQQVMIQVNISGDKNGVEPENTLKLFKQASSLKNLEIIGLMAIASKDSPYVDFKKMKNLFKKTNLKYLSMGMSSDYKIALDAGSNMVRLGTAVFGEGRRAKSGNFLGFFKELFS